MGPAVTGKEALTPEYPLVYKQQTCCIRVGRHDCRVEVDEMRIVHVRTLGRADTVRIVAR